MYIPPDADPLDFDFGSAYAPPAGEPLDFDFGASTSGRRRMSLM